MITRNILPNGPLSWSNKGAPDPSVDLRFVSLIRRSFLALILVWLAAYGVAVSGHPTTYSYGYRADGLWAWNSETSYLPKTYYAYDQGNIVVSGHGDGRRLPWE